jgi:hypothetical protein
MIRGAGFDSGSDVARAHGFDSWGALISASTRLPIHHQGERADWFVAIDPTGRCFVWSKDSPMPIVRNSQSFAAIANEEAFGDCREAPALMSG